MQSFFFKIYVAHENFHLEIESKTEDVTPFVLDFIEIFEHSVDQEKIHLNMIQKNSESFKKNIHRFIDHYVAQFPMLNRLRKLVDNLKTDEVFIIAPNIEIDQKQKMDFKLFLHAQSNDLDLSTRNKLHEKLDRTFTPFLNAYNQKSFGNESCKRYIGEPKQDKRVCRFCGLSQPNVSFKNTAHAISEAIGNKTIILNEECDSCNTKFNNEIESSLITYMDFIRATYGIKGKNGVPKIEGKNFTLENRSTVENRKLHIEYKQTEEEMNTNNAGGPLQAMKLEFKDKIIQQNIYKTLCKFAISVMENDQLPYFKETIQWINGLKEVEKLPKVAMLFDNKLALSNTVLNVNFLKSMQSDFPYVFCELTIGPIMFVFIIPFCSKDTSTFLKDDEIKTFLSHFSHYNLLGDYTLHDFSSANEFGFNLKINFQQREP